MSTDKNSPDKKYTVIPGSEGFQGTDKPLTDAFRATPDQVDALDDLITAIMQGGFNGAIAGSPMNSDEENDALQDKWYEATRAEAKAKLAALLVEARIDELKLLNKATKKHIYVERDGYLADRIKELQQGSQGALAHAESLTASGKQADNSEEEA